MKTYMCHYKPLTERRAFQEQQIRKHGLLVDWITDFDKEELPNEDLQIAKDDGLTLAEMSLLRKHFDAYMSIALRGYDYALILEDDVVLVDNFNQKLKEILDSNPSFDMIFLGSWAGNYIRGNEQIKLVPKDESLFTDCYLVSNIVAVNLLTVSLDKFYPADIYLSKFIQKHKLNVYHLSKGIAYQGSQTGLFKSTLR